MRQVVDEAGAIHRLSKRIGAGGQGEVWLTENGRRIVKILAGGADAERLRRQFIFLRRLDLTGLHVAKPNAVLRPPDVGYVADFLSEMVAIKALMNPPAENLAHWYLTSGGIRRRLRLLAHAGEAILGLHARGIVYADISHNNVFVSEPVHASEAWLIDLDNLSYDSDPKRAIYTPGYGAPEVVTLSAGCTTLSDAWAFAVLVWQTMTLCHPFIGDFVNGGEPELEDEALAGRLPWVEHSSDERNRSSTGLPPRMVLAGRLAELARRTFEDGLHERQSRPTIAEWVERLHNAADQTLRCTSCTGTFFVTEPTCPWCDEPRPKFGTVQLARWEPSHGLVQGAMKFGQFPITSEPWVLTARTADGTTGLRGREPFMRFSQTPKGMLVEPLNGRKLLVSPIASAHADRHEVGESGALLPENGWFVFHDDPSRPQRVTIIGRSR